MPDNLPSGEEAQTPISNYTIRDLREIHACLDEALRLAESSGAGFAVSAIQEVADDLEQNIDHMKREERRNDNDAG